MSKRVSDDRIKNKFDNGSSCDDDNNNNYDNNDNNNNNDNNDNTLSNCPLHWAPLITVIFQYLVLKLQCRLRTHQSGGAFGIKPRLSVIT